VFYTQGCPLRCAYCHNPELWESRGPAAISWAEALAWLHRRRGLLDGVVFSGGEPTTQEALGAALAQVRDLGFATALHTAGVYPERTGGNFASAGLGGSGHQGPFDRYADLTGVPQRGQGRAGSRRVLTCGVEYELRTTVHHRLLTPEDLMAMAQHLRSHGVRHWVLQEFRSQGCTDAELANSPSRLDPAQVAQLRELVPDITVRTAA